MRPQKPIVPELHLEPDDPAELRRLRKKARCRQSPTGAHHFYLTIGEDGKTDGPCRYCQALHSIVHKPTRKNKIGKGGKNKTAKETKAQEVITVKDLAEKSGVDAKKVRKVLRKQFGGGAGKNYTWKKGDAKVDEILKALKDLKNGTKGQGGGTKKAAPKTTKKTAPVTAEKSAEKPAEKPETKPETKGTVDMSVKRQRVAKKVSDKVIKETGKAPTTEQIDAAMAADKS